MRMRVNIATKPLQTHRRFFVFSSVAGALAAALFLLLGWHVNSVRKADAVFRSQIGATLHRMETLTTERRELEHFFSEPSNAQLHDRATFVNSILDARSFNWTRMFMDLETVLPGGVRVLSIEPKQVNGQAAVKLTVAASNEEEKQKFLRALEQSGVFSHLQLTSVHAPTRQESTGDQVILELTVIYSRA
jgi:type IV pilus assembly protein PilN